MTWPGSLTSPERGGRAPAAALAGRSRGARRQHLEGDDLGAGGRIDCKTGDVWHESAIEYALEVGEEDEESLEDEDR